MHVPFSREWCRAAANELERLREVANRICRCGQCGRELVNCTTESGCPYCLASSLTARLAEAEALCVSLQDIIDGHTSEAASVVEAFQRLENGEGLSLDEFFDKQKEVGE